ncbi:glutathione S-transferase 2-like isoform X4 [Vigna unguiculata]|uniref:glutathione S-transferase 2-like isoform X4 n=1 Tax=Vigna unguiculata TaxID=3917 RepID=UPI001015D358|nr:glutathione S-transferase 2-like isoform X4 [Vigna unguiculata]
MELCYGIKPPHQLAFLFFFTLLFFVCAYFMFDEEASENKLKLYSHWISSCSFRVRFALNIKGLPYDYQTVTTFSEPEFLKHNPIGFVPVLVDGDSVIFDSFAIIMYLEDKYPHPPLLPHDILKRAINFQAVTIVSSSIQPFQNYTVVKYIGEKIGPDEKLPWTQRVIGKGFMGRFVFSTSVRYSNPEIQR